MSTHTGTVEVSKTEKSLQVTDEKKPDEWRYISSHGLFEGRREVVIRHCGELYLLRITSKGKLILTK